MRNRRHGTRKSGSATERADGASSDIFGVLLASLGIFPHRHGPVFGRGAEMRKPAGSQLMTDGLWCARPDSERGAQGSDILLAEPVAGELLIGHAVELPAGIGEFFCGQTWIETVSETDQLRRAITVQHPRGVGVVADFDAAGQRADLPASYIFQREDRADFHGDRGDWLRSK